MVMKPLGDVAETVVARMQPADWSHERPGGNFCPECGHGLGDKSACDWCGWPDPEAMRKRTGEAVSTATPAVEKARAAAPEAGRGADPDKVRIALQNARDWLDGFKRVMQRERPQKTDPFTRTAYEIVDQELAALLAEIDAALN